MIPRAESHGRTQMQLAAEVLHSFGEVRLSALGCSMVPSLFPGDVLTVRSTQSNEIRAGDVVLCARGDRFFIHRVVAKEPTSEGLHWITCGDALPQPDPPVGAGEVLGRVTLVQRHGKQCALRSSSWFLRLVQFGIRRSPTLLRVTLGWHALRRRLAVRQQPDASLGRMVVSQC